MLRTIALLTLAALLTGCVNNNPPADPHVSAVPAATDVIATVNGQPITASQIQKPLVDYFGLDVLMQVMQLELAKQKAHELKVTVSEDDLKQELARSLSMLFKTTDKADFEQLVQQLLQELRISRPAFDVWVQTNAYLRKILDAKLKAAITDKHLKEAFGFLYGETAEVRHIQCSNLQELGEAQRRLQAGEKFEDVAKALSRDATSAARGGLLPPFSREAQSRQKAFKDAAFSLEPGQISEPVQSGDSYHLIKLEQKIMPKAVKFDDPEIKNVVRDWVYNNLMFTAMNELRNEFAVIARAKMVINDPTLRTQYDEKLKIQTGKLKDREDVRRDLAVEHQQSATRPIPATAPTPFVKPPATAPAKPTAPTTAP